MEQRLNGGLFSVPADTARAEGTIKRGVVGVRDVKKSEEGRRAAFHKIVASERAQGAAACLDQNPAARQACGGVPLCEYRQVMFVAAQRARQPEEIGAPPLRGSPPFSVFHAGI